MKKKTKILIAFVLIVVIAVGAYFLLSGKNSNTQLYNKVNNYAYGIKDGEKNIVNEVDNAIEVMLNEINSNSLNLENEKKNLELFLEVKGQYSVVKDQILNYGNFVTNVNSSKYLKPMNKSYSQLVNIYKDGYDYLQGTYYSSDFKTLSNATKITYIENFNIKIEKLVKTYNEFMYNAGMAYTMGAKNLINYNNCFKLRLSYYVTLINNSLNLSEEEVSLLPIYKQKIETYKNEVLLTDAVDIYVENSTVYDTLMKNFKSLNIVEIVKTNMNGTLRTYIDGISKVETRQLVNDYVTKIINE